MKSYKEYIEEAATKLEESLANDARDYDDSTIEAWVSQDPGSFIDAIERDYAWEIELPNSHYEKHTHTKFLKHDSCMMIIKNSNNIHHSIDGMYRKDDYRSVAACAFAADVIEFLLNKHNIKYPTEELGVLNRAR